jgi:hypothetical protein
MRIAVMIIALAVSIFIVLQSCAIGVGGTLLNSQSLKEGAAIGLLLAFLYVLGAAFAIGVPLISTAMFAVGALIAIPIGWRTGSDLQVWGWLSAILAVLSIFGFREKRRKQQRGGAN